MRDGRAETVAEAQAQELPPLVFGAWRGIAGMMNGYMVAEELGLDYGFWYVEQEQQWKATGEWHLDVLHLRLMLFLAFRSDYMSGYTYTEHDEIAGSLLQAISEKTGLPYQAPSVNREDNNGEE